MKKGKLVIILLCAGMVFSSFVHNFYVSICEVNHNPAEASLEISHRIFIDDLEKGLESMGAYNLNLGTEKETPKGNAVLNRYMGQHFKVSVDGKPVPWKMIGKEVENDVIWIYVEVSDVTKITSLEIENSMLTDVYDDQTNMINVTVGEEKKSLLLSGSKKKGTLTFGK